MISDSASCPVVYFLVQEFSVINAPVSFSCLSVLLFDFVMPDGFLGRSVP